jgi:AraC-like DNA-binding protein
MHEHLLVVKVAAEFQPPALNFLPVGSLTVDRHESEFGSWTSTAWTPDAGTPLARAVVRIWYFDGSLGGARERVFPDGTLELIVQFDTPHRPGIDAPAERFPPLCVTGLRSTAEVIEGPPGRCRVLGVKLSPSGAFALLRGALAELTDLTADLHDAIGRGAAELGTRLHGCRDGATAVRTAARWAGDRIARGAGPDPLVERAVAMIVADGGTQSMAMLEAWQGRSRTRFTAAFRDRVGATPKRFARIVRFDRALNALAARRHGLGEIALATGYYDQAHFTAEFREHAGLTPRAYLAALRYPAVTSILDPEQYFQDEDGSSRVEYVV